MISGTIVLEDQVITFSNQDNNITRYTICDIMTGKEETREVSGKDFSIALGVALNWNGEIPDQDAWRQAENVQPMDKDLRFIP